MISFIRLTAFETKKHLYEYKRILLSLLFMILFLFVISLLAVSSAGGEGTFQPLVVGVVSNDDRTEIDLPIKIISEEETISKFAVLVKTDLATAEENLASGEWVAYFVIPEGFVSSISNGSNFPLTLHLNAKNPMYASIIKAATEAGVAYLTISQSGIYATYDYAEDQGMSAEEQSQIFLPINYAYAARLINFNEYFIEEDISATGKLSAEMFYLCTFSVFFLLINIIIFDKHAVFTCAMHNRYQAAGISLVKTQLVRYLSFVVCFAVLGGLLFYLLGIKAIAGILLIAAYYMLTASIIKSEQGLMAFHLFAAMLMLFFSGSIIPVNFMPGFFKGLQYLTLNYWVLNLNDIFGLAVSVSAAAVMLILSVLIEKLHINAHMNGIA